MRYRYWLIAAVLITHLNAGEKGWKAFGKLVYSPTSCHLKKGIDYLEVRLYETNSDYTKIIDKHYKVTKKCYRKPLERFDPKTVSGFEKSAPISSSPERPISSKDPTRMVRPGIEMQRNAIRSAAHFSLPTREKWDG